jgi:hypothetical protein
LPVASKRRLAIIWLSDVAGMNAVYIQPYTTPYEW